MIIANSETRKKDLDINDLIAEVGKELGYRKYLYPQKIKANPRIKETLETRYLKLEKVLDVLKEIRDKEFLKLDTLE